MKVKSIIAITLLSAILVGCGILHKNQGVVGKASIAEDKAKTRIEMVDNTVAKVNVERLDHIGAFASGVSYSLNKETNASPEVIVAMKLNDRVIALANKPDFNEAKEIALLVDQLITNQVAGEKLLRIKDKEIESLMSDVKDLQIQKEQALKSYFSLANRTAETADQYKTTLGEMDKWGGMGAMWYGFKRFIARIAWIMGIGSVLFLVLRLAAMSNPIAGSIFSIFNVFGSWMVNAIKVIFPQALSIAGHVTTSAYNNVRGTLTKVVDSIQMAKNNAKVSGKEMSISDVLTELEKSMNEEDKAIIEELKKQLQWK